MNPPTPNIAGIAADNDKFRKTLARGGRFCITTGLMFKTDPKEVLQRVIDFNTFTEDNDPYGEHDFGSFATKEGVKVLWKIDYIDDPDHPDDPNRSTRALTLMLAEEY